MEKHIIIKLIKKRIEYIKADMIQLEQNIRTKESELLVLQDKLDADTRRIEMLESE